MLDTVYRVVGGEGEGSISRQEKGFEVGLSGEAGCWRGCGVS